MTDPTSPIPQDRRVAASAVAVAVSGCVPALALCLYAMGQGIEGSVMGAMAIVSPAGLWPAYAMVGRARRGFVLTLRCYGLALVGLSLTAIGFTGYNTYYGPILGLFFGLLIVYPLFAMGYTLYAVGDMWRSAAAPRQPHASATEAP